VTHALALLQRKIDVNLALLGCPDTRQLSLEFFHRDQRPK
jgi:hypothetical protein